MKSTRLNWRAKKALKYVFPSPVASTSIALRLPSSIVSRNAFKAASCTVFGVIVSSSI